MYDDAGILIETHAYAAKHLFPGERVVVGLTYAGDKVIFSISVGAEKDMVGLGTTVAQAIHNIIALRRKKAEAIAQKQKEQEVPGEPLPDVR